eukprot:scaffold9863_cov70-Cyclotella_meneghiniana.AAC.2
MMMLYFAAAAPAAPPLHATGRCCESATDHRGGGGCGGDRVEEAAAASRNYVTAMATATWLACSAASFRPSAAIIIINATIKYNLSGIGLGSSEEQYNN